MKLVFSEHAWDDYLYWQLTDRKILQRINLLIREIQRTPLPRNRQTGAIEARLGRLLVPEDN